MERDWDRLARAIKKSREAAGMTQKDLAAAAAIAEGSVQNLESGVPRMRIPPSLGKVEQALGWAVGSGFEILNGAPGPVLIEKQEEGMYVARLPEDDVRDAVTRSAIAVSDNLTAREIRELTERITAELKERGLL